MARKGPANRARTRRGHAQIGFPQAAEAGAPEPLPMALGQDAPQLRQRIVHVKYLVAQDLVENGASRRVVFEHLAIDTEAAGGSLFRQMQECEQHVIASVNAQVVDAVSAG